MMSPNRPTDEFLKRVGIAFLPENVGIVFDEGVGRGRGYGLHHTAPSQYLITAYDKNRQPVLSTNVHAHEYKGRTKQDIFNDLQRTLVSQFNAVPIADNDDEYVAEKKLLRLAGVPLPLPSHIKVRLELRAEMPYLLIWSPNNKQETILELRETKAHPFSAVLQDVKNTLERIINSSSRGMALKRG